MSDGPVPQQPPMNRAPAPTQPSTRSRSRGPAYAHVLVSLLQLPPRFG